MLKTLKLKVLLLLFVPLFACAAEDSPYTEGKHYFKLDNEVDTSDQTKVEVLELFWYGCPHCYALEPRLAPWVRGLPDYVEFERMPAVVGRGWDIHARAYYAAEILGVLENTHRPLFDALHKERQRLLDQSSLARFYATMGVDEDKFNKTYESFAVNSKINQAAKKQRDYQISGVPAIIVNGKYRVPAQNEMLEVVDYLVEKERN